MSGRAMLQQLGLWTAVGLAQTANYTKQEGVKQGGERNSDAPHAPALHPRHAPTCPASAPPAAPSSGCSVAMCVCSRPDCPAGSAAASASHTSNRWP